MSARHSAINHYITTPARSGWCWLACMYCAGNNPSVRYNKLQTLPRPSTSTYAAPLPAPLMSAWHSCIRCWCDAETATHHPPRWSKFDRVPHTTLQHIQMKTSHAGDVPQSRCNKREPADGRQTCCEAYGSQQQAVHLTTLSQTAVCDDTTSFPCGRPPRTDRVCGLVMHHPL